MSILASRAPSEGLPEPWQMTSFFIGLGMGLLFYLVASMKYPKDDVAHAAGVFGMMAFFLAAFVQFVGMLAMIFLGEFLTEDLIMGFVIFAEAVMTFFYARNFIRECNEFEVQRKLSQMVYLFDQGQQSGPFTKEQICELSRDGALSENACVCRAGDTAWTMLADDKEVKKWHETPSGNKFRRLP